MKMYTVVKELYNITEGQPHGELTNYSIVGVWHTEEGAEAKLQGLATKARELNLQVFIGERKGFLEVYPGQGSSSKIIRRYKIEETEVMDNEL